jgi:phosphohistidine phosphatase
LQTVEPLGRDFDTSEEVGLEATPKRLLAAADWPDGERNVVVVGHQPTLGQAAARVLEGRDGDISIKKGAIWWFVMREDDDGRKTLLKAVLDPDTLES